MEWLAMAVPAVTAIVLFLCFQHKTVWWEFLIPFAVSVACIASGKYMTETCQTRDTEYWGGWVKYAEYYEDWNEGLIPGSGV